MNKPKKTRRNVPFRFKPALLLPLTPFQRRIAELSARIALPHSHADAEMLKRRAVAQMESDLAFRKKCHDNMRKIPHWGYMRTLSGSGLLMANTLRDYFREYCSRLMNHGFQSLPGSFNVVESFLKFDHDLSLFDMREEREHLLAVDDYFDWYKSREIPMDPEILIMAMKEGLVYEYNMSGDTAGCRLASSHSTLAIAGVSLVRHQNELSCMLIAGEQPPNPPDANILGKDSWVPVKGKEKVGPDPSLGIKDRYLDQLPGFARVILLARFDLQTKKYYVRSINLDNGNKFTVLTDDVNVVRPLSDDDFNMWKATTAENLARYDVLFSTLASLIFLPVAFVGEIEHVKEMEFKTECFAKQFEKQVQEAIEELGKGCCVNSTIIHCLARSATRGLADGAEIKPPEMTFQSEGYWKRLLPGEIGEDKEGTPIIGRSWVTRTENWSARKPQAFLLTRSVPAVSGPDPGIIYVMRSEAHGLEIYKIGLTRRTSWKRSRELSSATGVPLPFGILAQWEVGDCAGVEAVVHQKLDGYRINARREFFRLPLRTIVGVINSVVEEITPEAQ